MNIALVLPGGANRCAAQVGVLAELTERGVLADMVVGTSGGAINGAMYCAIESGVPLLEGAAKQVAQLQALWLGAKADDWFPGNRFQWAWNALTSSGLVSNSHLVGLVKKHLPPYIAIFADFRIPLYVTTTDLITTELVVYGDNPFDFVVWPVAASAAFPYVVEPVLYDGRQLTDGGVTAHTPVKEALARGAKTLYVVDMIPLARPAGSGPVSNLFDVGARVHESAIRHQAVGDMSEAAEGAVLHRIPFPFYSDLDIRDMSKTAELITAGQQAAAVYLDNPHPEVLHNGIFSISG